MYKKKLKTSKDNWEIPEWLFNLLDSRFNFTLDAAATRTNKKCIKFCEDGLSESRGKNRVFCNPPFSQKNAFIEKAYKEITEGDCPCWVRQGMK